MIMDIDYFNYSSSNLLAVYCLECVREINNMCSLCMNPVDYDDCSDFSEER